MERALEDGNSVSGPREKLPKHLVRDGAKWLMMPSKTILDSVSVWPERQNFLTAILHILVFLSYGFSIVGNVFYITGKNVGLGSICYSLSLLIVSIEAVARRVLVYSYRNRFSELLSKVYFEFWPSTVAGKELHEELLQESRYLFYYCSAYTFSAFLTGCQYIMVPYFEGNLPFRTAYPFAWQESPYYELLYVWESFFAMEVVFTICGMDLFFVSLLFNSVAQFKLLRVYLVTNFENIMKNPERTNKDAMEFMVSCIQRHYKLIWACNEIDQLFTFFILIQCLTSMSTVCLSSFVVSVVKEDIGTCFTYLMGHLCEILIYCYMGNELILESTELSNAVFQCGWHLSHTERDLQKSLVLIMVRAQKPIRISAGGFGFLSLPSFLKLIQFSFSVYTLLNSMMNKQNSIK